MMPMRVHIDRLVLQMPGVDARGGDDVRQAIESTLHELSGEPATETGGTGSAAAAGREAALAIHRAVHR